MNNQIQTIAQLEVVLASVREYYNANACMISKPGKEKNITVAQLLNGSIDIATLNLKEAKQKGSF